MYTFQIAFQTAFFSKERPEKRPSLPPCAQSVSATRTLWIRRTHNPDPLHAWDAPFFTRRLPSDDASDYPEIRFVLHFYTDLMQSAPLFGGF